MDQQFSRARRALKGSAAPGSSSENASSFARNPLLYGIVGLHGGTGGERSIRYSLLQRFRTRTTCTLQRALPVTVDATDCDQARPPSEGAPRTMRSTLLWLASSTMVSAG